MRGAKAKAIRRQVYGDLVSGPKGRQYGIMQKVMKTFRVMLGGKPMGVELDVSQVGAGLLRQRYQAEKRRQRQ